jgi:small-conductance mechanosensitive channel
VIDNEIKKFISSVEIENVFVFILLLAVLVVVVKLNRILSRIVTKKFPKKRMYVFQWIPVFNFMIYFLGIVIGIYVIFEPSQEVFLWFVASTIVAFALAFKDILFSIIAGVVLLVDKPFQVGDRITFNNEYGEIVSIGLRSVKLLTLDESIVTIPNSRFINDTVSSSSAGQLNMMTTVDVYVAIDKDLNKIKTILEKIALKSSYLNIERKPFVVIKEVLGIGGVISAMMTTKCILKDARKEKSFQTDFLISVNREFKNQHIKRIIH